MTKEIKNGEKISYIIDRYRGWIALVLFVIIMVLGYLIVLKDKYNNYVQSKNVNLAGIEQALKNVENSKSAIQNVKKVTLSDSEGRLIDMAIPKEFDFNSVVSQLTSLVEANNFSVNNIEVDKDISKEDLLLKQNVKSVKISMSVTGENYESFKRLLSAIEQSSMIFDVISVDFNSNQSYSLTIKSYYLN